MYNESSKKCTMRYLAKLKEVRFRVKPEEYSVMKQAAENQGYSSMRQFFLAAIHEKIGVANEEKTMYENDGIASGQE